MKNERHKPDNPTETRTIQSRTQTAAQNPELGNSDRTGYRNPESLSTAAAKMPRRSGSPKGSGEVLERDRGSKSPVSFQPPPRGANKIYKSDEVFRIGESKTNPIRKTQFPYKIKGNQPTKGHKQLIPQVCKSCTERTPVPAALSSVTAGHKGIGKQAALPQKIKEIDNDDVFQMPQTRGGYLPHQNGKR